MSKTKVINIILTEEDFVGKLKLELSKLSLKKDDAILISYTFDNSFKKVNIQKLIEKILPGLSEAYPDNIIIVLDNLVKITSISSDEMNKYGWYRKEQLKNKDDIK